jgi:toxin FitB
VSGALLDTSVVIGDLEPLGMKLPATMAISVITVGELRAGVRLADDPVVRAARQTRLNAIRQAFEPIPVDEAVAEHYGDILAAARSAGRSSKATDLLIIATAAATGRVLHTLDERQAALSHVAGVPLHTDV